MSAGTPLDTMEARPIEPLLASAPFALPSARVTPRATIASPTSPVAVATASKSEPKTAPSKSEPKTELKPERKKSESTVAADTRPTADEPAKVTEPLKMTLLASSPSWVIAWVDGKKTINRLLEADEQASLEATRELVVTAGDGGAIVMTINEAATRTLGKASRTATVKVNHANLPKYLGRDEPRSVSPAQ
jgi:hypothetical protein